MLLNKMFVMAATDRFVQHWNDANLRAACEFYADDATFVTESGILEGRQEVLDCYLAKYSNQTGCGTLSLELVEFRSEPGSNMASAVFVWSIRLDDGAQHSGYSLVTYGIREGKVKILQDMSI